MRRLQRCFSIAMLTAACCAAMPAYAQQSTRPGTAGAQGIGTEPQRSLTVSGTVRSFTHSATGATDGFVLDNGTVIHFPAYLGRQVTALIDENAQVRVSGILVSGTDRDAARLVEARSITDVASNKTLTVTGSGTSQPGSTLSGEEDAATGGAGGAAGPGGGGAAGTGAGR